MIRIRVVGTGVAGTPYYMNFYFDADTSTEAQAAWDNLFDAMVLQAGTWYAAYRLDFDHTIPVIDPATGAITGFFNAVGATDYILGANNDQLLPTGTQLLAQLRTSTVAGGRLLQGRQFWGAYCENGNSAAGAPVPAVLTGLQAVYDAILANGPDLVVWSRKNGTAAPVQSVSISENWSSLRTRRPQGR